MSQPGFDNSAVAASLLRPFLAHAYLHKDLLDTPSNSGAKLDRRICRQELQLLSAYFQSAESGLRTERPLSRYEPLTTCYLSWLVEDAELAQQVVDVWNNIVEQGRADRL